MGLRGDLAGQRGRGPQPGTGRRPFHAAARHSADVPDAARGAYAGLFGRGYRAGDDPGTRLEKMAATSARDLLEAAAGRLGRRCERLEIQGRTERAVVAASADADLLVVARDGDQTRLGPKSLGKITRFVVDHAACPVLLVWPESAPDVATIPPPPHHPPRRFCRMGQPEVDDLAARRLTIEAMMQL